MSPQVVGAASSCCGAAVGQGVAVAIVAVWSVLATTVTSVVWLSGIDDGHEAMELENWQHFGNLVRNSQRVLGDDPRLTPEKMTCLANRLQSVHVERLALVTGARHACYPARFTHAHALPGPCRRAPAPS